MSRRAIGLTTALAATAALTVGCGEGRAMQTPDIVPANNTIEQVTHNLGYENVLGALSLKQHFRVEVSGLLGSQSLNLYNYTDAPVNPQTFQKIANLYENTVGNNQTFSFTINPNSPNSNVPIQATTETNLDKEHDFVLVPNSTAESPLFDGGGADAETTDLVQRNMNANQTISVVDQPEDEYGQPQPFLGFEDGLTTEMCQALDQAFAQPPADSANALTTRLAQETVCNSVGSAVQSVLQNTNYSTFSAIESNVEGTILIPDVGEFAVKEFAIPPSLYGAMQQALA